MVSLRHSDAAPGPSPGPGPPLAIGRPSNAAQGERPSEVHVALPRWNKRGGLGMGTMER